MTSPLQLELKMKAKKKFDLIRHDSAEMWGFRYGLTHAIATLKLWPAPVFSCV
jgi:hypothetical protein